MPDMNEPEKESEREVETQATRTPDDEETAREEFELQLMEDGASEAGQEIGEQLD